MDFINSGKKAEVLVMSVPLVTCIVTSYNKLEYLYEAIDSVLMQDYPRIELLVADDCSEGFNENVFREYINKNKRGNIVKSCVIKQEKNVGTVKNTNTMLMQSTGDYFIGLDGDDVIYDESVFTKVVNRFISTGAELLSCSRMKCNEDLSEIQLCPSQKHIASFSALHSSLEQFGHLIAFDFLEIDAHIFSRSVVDKLGLYDEEFRQWQDGPWLAKFTSLGGLITSAFDIIYIKYRQGGVSNKPQNNTDSVTYLDIDKLHFIEKYTIPHKSLCPKNQFYKMVCWYEMERSTSKLHRIVIRLKFEIFKQISKAFSSNV